MKTLQLIAALLCFHLAAQAHTGGPGNDVSASSMKRAMEYLGYDISAEQQCNISQGATCYYYKTFYAGQTYDIVAFSEDADVTDVDIWLYEMDGSEYDKDVASDDVGEIHFTPSVTRTMKVVFKNAASGTPSYQSLCQLIIGYKDAE